jgi:RNA polymerase sigma-70 factor, ECF subfamily
VRHPPPSDELRKARFEKVYEDNHGRILGYVLRRSHDPDAAADVVAETFLVAWRRIDTVPSGDDARLWLYGVARRVLAEHRRRSRRHGSAVADLTVQLRARLNALPGDMSVEPHDLAPGAPTISAP